MFQLQAGEQRFIHFPILPVVRATFTVTVYADSIVRRQSASKSVTVAVGISEISLILYISKEIHKCCDIVISAFPAVAQYDGITNYYHTPYLIDLVNSGSVYIPHLYIPVPARFTMPGQREHLYVPGSGKCTVSLAG